METYKGGIPPFYLYFDLRSGAWRVGIKTTMMVSIHNLKKSQCKDFEIIGHTWMVFSLEIGYSTAFM